jgi:hypothetical protein
VSREEAIRLFNIDKTDERPANYSQVLEHLGLTNDDIEKAITYKPLFYEKYTSKVNRLYTYLVKRI